MGRRLAVMLVRVFVVILLLFQSAYSAEITSPAGKGSQTPNLFVAGGTLYMTWLEASGEGHALKFSAYDGTKWSVPTVIVSGVPFFVNWADFPSMLVLENGMMAAHWLQKNGKGTYAYDVLISTSTDQGKTWSSGTRPHRDKVQGEHGFVSMISAGEGRFTALWLDPRKSAGNHDGHSTKHEQQLMAANFEKGAFQPEILLDDRVCDCCQTSAAVTKSGAIAVYRDRSPSEVRDISYVTLSNGKWSQPKTLHADQWKIAGCPVNGPSVAASGDNVVVAWFSAAGDKPRVQALLSSDGGRTFGKPIRIDNGKPNGRVHAIFLKNGDAMVSWLELSDKGADIRVRRIRPDASTAEPIIVAASSKARASGFVRMAPWGSGAVVAWTQVESDGNSIRLSQID